MQQQRYIIIDTLSADYILGQALRQAREREGFSVKRIAAIWGVSEDYIEELEHCWEHDPHISEIAEYLKHLHLVLVVKTEPAPV